MEVYTEPELRQKIEAEGRRGDDPFVLAYNHLKEMLLSDARRYPSTANIE